MKATKRNSTIPSGARYVSLLASSEDASGFTVEQTVFRANAIAGVP